MYTLEDLVTMTTFSMQEIKKMISVGIIKPFMISDSGDIQVFFLSQLLFLQRLQEVMSL